MDSDIKIEKIKPAGKNFILTVTGLENPLPVSEELVYKYRLKAGIIITASQLEQLKTEAERIECDRQVSQFLGVREHSVGELKAKLARRRFDGELINKTVRKYVDMGLVDDARFAKKLAEQTMERNPSGRVYLTAVLRRKKISRELAEQVADMVLSGRDENELAVDALKKRWHVFCHFELERARRKAYNYLSRRGIGYAAAKAAFERLYNLQKEVGED
ncbi:MAG: regulatory protein RecX [candidate division Zixibacteria bacterium]|nr:regulatory protein RecX [candidate division Zixibacteria bacterium]